MTDIETSLSAFLGQLGVPRMRPAAGERGQQRFALMNQSGAQEFFANVAQCKQMEKMMQDFARRLYNGRN